QNSHVSEIIWNQIWGYLQSGAFNIVSVSIILPIILFLLESIFKFAEKIEDEHRERQYNCIIQTEEMWNNITSLTTKVRFFELDDNDCEQGIKNIIQQLYEFRVSAEDVVISLMHEFSSQITNEDIDNFLYSINIL